jgi:hypothetical protein
MIYYNGKPTTVDDARADMNAVGVPGSVIDLYLATAEVFSNAKRAEMAKLSKVDPEGHWVTIDGTHVHITKGGSIDSGPDGGRVMTEKLEHPSKPHSGSAPSHPKKREETAKKTPSSSKPTAAASASKPAAPSHVKSARAQRQHQAVGKSEPQRPSSSTDKLWEEPKEKGGRPPEPIKKEKDCETWLRQNFYDYPRKLDYFDDVIHGLGQYEDGRDFEAINTILRAGKDQWLSQGSKGGNASSDISPSERRQMAKRAEDAIPHIDHAIDQWALPRDAVFYRAFDGLDHTGKPLLFKPGDVFTDKGYVSTSLYKPVVQEFVGSADTSYTCSIKVPKGTKVASMTLADFAREPDNNDYKGDTDSGSSSGGEQWEMLLGRGHTFRVLGVEKGRGGENHMRLELVS